MRNGIYFTVFIMMLQSCSIFTGPSAEPAAAIGLISFDKSSLSLDIGRVDFISLSVSPSGLQKDMEVTYSYDGLVIAVDGDSFGATISALRAGSTALKASAGGISATCVITVTGINPVENFSVITTGSPVIELEEGTVKQVLVSLTGGTSQNMTQFNWSIDKNTIAGIETTGQNCVVTGKTNGTARITVTHPGATYPLEILVFVKPDPEKPVYVTTDQNIISLAAGAAERQVSVSLVNGTPGNESGFVWETLHSEESGAGIIALTGNGENALLSPLAAGSATVRVTHPEAPYPLDIRVRVVTIVENIYIEPSAIRVTVSGSGVQTVTARLSGSSRAVSFDPGEFTWAIEPEGYCAMTVYQDGIALAGKKNGIAKITVSHPAAAFPRELLVFVENQTSGAVSTAMYITTSQNYIRTKIGADDVELSVELVGGETGDEKNFTWAAGDPSMIALRTVHGEVGGSRAVNLFQRAGGKAYLTGLKEGVTTLSVTHPKIIGSTGIMVRIYPETAVLELPLYIQSPAILGIVRGQTRTAALTITGNYTPSDDAAFSWTSEDEGIAGVQGNGKEAHITANGNGQTYITVWHPKAEGPKKILAYVAETEAALAAYKLLYTEKTAYRLVAGQKETLRLMSANIQSSEIAAITWESGNAGAVSVIPGTSNMEGIITGLAAGTAAVTASLPGIPPVEFNVIVYPAGTDLTLMPEPKYFTTTQNVLQFSALNTSKTVSVTAVRLDASSYSGIAWQCDNPDVAEVAPNGTSATVTAKENGNAVITVSHPDVENTLAITVRVGEEYVIVNPSDPFITASQDILPLTEGSQGVQVTAELRNSAKTSGFSWAVADTTAAALTPMGNSCFVAPKSPGQTMLTISHPDAVYDKKVLVLVDNAERNLTAIPYLTTSQNQVLMTTGARQAVSVRLKNNQTETSGFAWQNDNPQALQIIESGPQASFNAITAGVARVKVTHTSCQYPMEITAIITDNPADASANPYITSAQNIITVTRGGNPRTVSVTLAGGLEPDNAHFTWQADNGKIISLTANGQNGVVKGLAAGECRITVAHPKAAYSFTLVVICEEASPSSNLYVAPSHPILTMKPADAEQSVNAALIGGTAEDKYGFTWYADNYNVIDLTYQANTAVISPKQEGTATITITHPKAAYDGKMTVRVTEYSTFAFSQPSLSIMEGTTQFVSMQVPAMDGAYSGRITYTTDNAKIVTVTGTNKVAQVTAVGAGTAIVSAASPSGAKSEMMVYVEEAAEAAKPYITSTASVLSMKAGDGQQSVSATLVGQGVVQTDQYNLKWAVDNPAVASLIGSTGTNVLVKAAGAGETTIRISHEKTDTVFTLYVQVEGVTKGIVLNKNYAALETGKTVELTAAITGGTSEDYKNITWTAGRVNNADVVNILGTGKTVAVYGIAAGQVEVKAEFNNNSDTCSVVVQAAKQFSFNTQTMRVQPGQTKTFSYTLVPADAPINWITNSNDYVTYTVNTSAKTVSVTGVFDGNAGSGSVTRLSGSANSLSASINITCAWDYQFSLGKSLIRGDPRADPAQPDKFVIPYEVNPANAKIEVQISRDIAAWTVDTANRKITLTPRGEGDATLTVTAVNSATGARFSTQTCAVSLNYASVTLQPSLVSVNGRFSRYNGDSGTVVLGDGEDLTLKLGVAEANVSCTLSNVRYEKSSGPDLTLTDRGEGMWKITHPNDVKVHSYTVYHDIKFYYEGSPVTVNQWKQEKADVTFRDGANNVVYSDTGETLYVSDTGLKVKYKVSEEVTGGTGGRTSKVTEKESNLFLVARSPETVVGAIKIEQGFYDDLSYLIRKYFAYDEVNVTMSREPLNPPRTVTESDFKANPAWYGPPFEGGTYIRNDTARYEASPSTAVSSSVTAGYISGSIVHNGVSQAFKIPVVVETRDCPAN
jgi:hypothetical protein